ASLLVDVQDARAAEQGVAGSQRAMELEFLLAVEQARDVGAQLAQEVGMVAARLTEGRHEGRRRDDVTVLGGLAHAVVQVERVAVADGTGELLDLAALDGDDERRELASDQRLVELDGHQAWPFFMVRSRNFSRLGTTKRSWRPSAIFSLASHAS